MGLLTNARLAWGVTLATVALWSFGATGQSIVKSVSASTTGPRDAWAGLDRVERLAGMSIDDNPGPQAPGCESAQPTALPPTASISPSGLEGTFHLCGAPDAASERAIEQLIAGRGFSARLIGRSAGCAELVITVSPNSSAQGRNSTFLSVSGLSIQLVSENGTTRATIGER